MSLALAGVMTFVPLESHAAISSKADVTIHNGSFTEVMNAPEYHIRTRSINDAHISTETTADGYGISRNTHVYYGPITEELNGQKYCSSYLKNADINSGKGTLDVNYGPAVYCVYRDSDGNIVLDERALVLADGNAKELIHPIKSEPTYEDPHDALVKTYEQIKYASDEELYGVSEAWANPEMTLEKGEGDCEDSGFLAASRNRFQLEESLGPKECFAVGCTFEDKGETVGHLYVLARYPDGNWYRQEPTGGFESRYRLPGEKDIVMMNDKVVRWVR